MSYRDDFREGQRGYYWTLPRVVLAATVGIALVGGAAWVVNLSSQPAKVLSKTFDADNIIQNYEYFHTAHGNFLARTAQVKQFKQFLSQEGDNQEKSRLRIEMAAVQQSCRDLARRYNANSTMVNKGIFKGQSAPETLNAEVCE